MVAHLPLGSVAPDALAVGRTARNDLGAQLLEPDLSLRTA